MKKNPAFTVWFTGLPCSGKTTLARSLCRRLKRRGIAADLIDGDAIRRGWCRDLRFSRKDRMENIRRAAVLAALLNRAGITAAVALVSPFRRARAQARRLFAGRFAEVFVDCPLTVCQSRDVKGHYRLARAGKVKSFTGISDLYEAPAQPEIVLKTAENSLEACLRLLDTRLREKGFF